jgi:hypothetical protein
LWDGVLDVKAGRQIRLDTIGFFAFDGIESTAHMPLGLDVSLFSGYEVQGGKILGFDALALDGTDNGGRNNIDENYYPDRKDPIPLLCFGSEISWSPVRWFDTSAAVRIIGLNDRLQARTFGAMYAIGNQWFKTDGQIILNPLLDRRDNYKAAFKEGTLITSGQLSMGAKVPGEVWVIAGYELYRPVFSFDSIFNIFNILPRRDLSLKVKKSFGRALSVAAWGFIRLADKSAGIDGDKKDSLFSGAGGGTGANYFKDKTTFSMRFTVQREWGESRIGTDVGGSRSVINDRIDVGLRGSFWHIEDNFSSAIGGNTAGYVATLKFNMDKWAHIKGEFENYFGGGMSPRVIAMLLLQLDFLK